MSTLEELQNSINKSKESQNMQNGLQQMAPENISDSEHLKRDMERRGVKIVPRTRGKERKKQGLQLGSFYTGAETQTGEYAHGVEQLYSYTQPEGESEESKQRGRERRRRYEESYAENPVSTALGSFGVDVAAAINPLTRRAAFSSLGGKIAGGAAGMGTHAAALSGAQYTTEEENRLNNMFTSGGVGALFGGVGGGLRHAFDAFKPSAATSVYTPEELMYNLEASKGLPAGLGTVVGNPSLQFFQENVLARLPGGATKTMQETSKGIAARGEDLYSRMGGKASEGVDEKEVIEGKLQEASKIIKDKSAAGYKQMDDLASNVGAYPRYNATKETAKNAIDAEKRHSLKWENFPEDIKKKLQGIVDNETEQFSFNDSNLYKSDLLAEARQYAKDGKGHYSHIFNDLASAVEKDMETAAKNSGSDELWDLYKSNQEFYKKNVKPLNEKEIRKFTNDVDKEKSDEVLGAFLKTGGKGDKNKKFSQLTNQMDDEGMAAIRSEYFSPAFQKRNFSPVEFSSLFNNLGKKQQQTMFKDNPEILEEMKQYSHLVNSNKGSSNIMFNPPTGQKAIEALLLTGLGGAGAYGYQQGGLTGLVAAPFALLGAGKAANKFLTSEKIREGVVKNMVTGPQASSLRKALEELSRRTATPLATQFNQREEQ